MVADAGAAFVSPADFYEGLLGMGFSVTAEEAEVLMSVLETDENGNINLAGLTAPGSPLAEQLAAMQDFAVQEAAPAYAYEAEAPAPAIPQTAEALAALEALERGDEEALAEALARMPPDEAEALQAALAGDAPDGDGAAEFYDGELEAAPEMALAAAQPLPSPRSMGTPSKRVSYGSLQATFPVAVPTGGAGTPSRDGGLSRRPSLMRRSSAGAGQLALLSQRGSEGEGSFVGSEAESSGAVFTPDDLRAMPPTLTQLLLQHRVRVIDTFRAMDSNEDGVISPAEFSRGVRALGHEVPEEEISALFAQMDVDGSGTLDYSELHRLLRVGKAAETSRYLRRASHARHVPQPRRHDRSPPRLASTCAKRLSTQDLLRRAAGGAPEPEAEPAAVAEELWPAALRAALLRERLRVVDLFRNWEGGDEEGSHHISVEDFKAGLHLLGIDASRRDIRQLFGAMGGEGGAAAGGAGGEGGEAALTLSFRELRRQLRRVAQRGTSHYLRAAAQQGVALEAAAPPGALLSGVAPLREAQAALLRDGGGGGAPAAADELAASLTLLPPGRADAAGAAGGASRLSSSAPSLASLSALGLGSSSAKLGGDGTVRLGAAASDAKSRALLAAESAAAATEGGQVTLQAAEMGVQQWARAHYAALLPELRKWELRAHGEIGFETFAESLQLLGFPSAGKWQELQMLWASWAPNERGLLHWQRVRGMMTGGRMVKVQHKKHTTAQYFKQPSRAGEGFGNRSSPRFREPTHSELGPGKYKPELSKADGRAAGAGAVGTHSGKLLHTAARFSPAKADVTPGPGLYRPRYTLTESRHNV